MLKKIFRRFGFVFLLSLFVLPSISTAQVNIEQLQAQIASLLSQVKILQLQLAAAGGNGGDGGWCYTFNKNFGIGVDGDEVSALNTILIKEGLRSNSSAYGSYFDEDIASDVSAFQEKYRSEILTPSKLRSGTGYVGKGTRAKLNKLYGCVKEISVFPVDDTARNLATDASIKSRLMNARAQAELYYDSNSNSYLNVCNNSVKGIAGILSEIGVMNGTYQSSCVNSVNTWAAIAKLKTANAGYFCVDSAGAAKNITSSGPLSNLCPSENLPPAPVPLSISYISPTSGTDGRWINIYGSGFTNSTIVNITKQGQDVKTSLFDANSVKFISSNQLDLYFDLSDSAINTPGSYQIIAINESQKSNPVNFTLVSQVASNPAPIITSVVPGSGSVGTVVTINGYNFNTSSNGMIVYLGLNQITVTAESQYKITFTIPIDNGSNACRGGCVATTPGNYKIWVRNNNTTDPSSNVIDFTVKQPQSSTALTIKNSTSVPTQNISINLPNQVLGGFDVITVGEPVSVKTMVFTLPIYITDNTSASLLLSGVTIQDMFGGVVAGPVDAIVKNGQMTIEFTDKVTFPVGTKTYQLKGKLSAGMLGMNITLSTNPSTLWSGAEGQTTGNIISLLSNGSFSMNKMNLQGGAQLSVSKDPSSPSLAVVYREQSDVTMGAIRVRASNGSARITNANVKLTAGDISEITNVSVWDGGSMIGSGTFSPNSYTLNINLNPTLINQDTDKVLVLKVSVVNVSSFIDISQATIVDVTSITGTDVGSGYSISGNNISSSFSGIIIQ